MSDARKLDLIWHLSHKSLKNIAAGCELSVRADASLESLQAAILIESDIRRREMLLFLARPPINFWALNAKGSKFHCRNSPCVVGRKSL